MAYLTAKAVAVLSGLTGVSTSVAVPIALHSKNNYDGFATNNQGGGNKFHNSHTKRINFNTLWESINKQWVEKWVERPQNLPWKENLDQIILGGNGDKWSATEIFWTTCANKSDIRQEREEGISEELTDDCGYLWLNDGGLEFKIKAVQKPEGWIVFVVRNNEQEKLTHYYDSSESHWKAISGDAFQKLTFPDENSQWNQVTSPAFTTSEVKNR